MEEHELWRTARGELERGLGAATFQRWIAPLHFTGLCDQGVARLRADSKFHADWAARHYAEKVASAFADAGAKVERVSIEGPGAPGRGGADDVEGVGDGLRQGTAEETALARAPAAGHDGLRSSKLDPRCTFETFVVGKPNELAHAAARRVSESAGADYNPVFLHGGVGLGKTHLMHAIAWRLRRTRPNASVLYLSAEQFMYRFVQALRQRDTISFKQEFRAVDVLMVDDIQFIADKNSTQEEFFHTFNSLIDEGRQIVLSGDRAPGDIEGLSERITSRLQWGLVVDIHPTNYELRLGILQAKAEVALSRNPGLSISPKVLEFLAHRISANVRVLEGALTRLVANATLIGKPVDLDMAHQHLGDLLRQTDKKVTIEEIMRKVAEHFNLRMSDMTSARRARAVARPRQIAMYLSKTLTPRSLPDIGKRFGGRDHTTVMHAIRKVEELMAADAQIAEDVELLRRMLEA